MPDSTAAVTALRRHRDVPRSLSELVLVADHLLREAGVPLARPTTERTVRFYVSRGVVRPPVGRGASARWEYGHLLDLLAVRLAQHDGTPLDVVARDRARSDDAALEVVLATRLGVVAVPGAEAALEPPPVPAGEGWRRFAVAPGAELHLASDHLLLQDPARFGALLAMLARALPTADPEH